MTIEDYLDQIRKELQKDKPILSWLDHSVEELEKLVPETTVSPIVVDRYSFFFWHATPESQSEHFITYKRGRIDPEYFV